MPEKSEMRIENIVVDDSEIKRRSEKFMYKLYCKILFDYIEKTKKEQDNADSCVR